MTSRGLALCIAAALLACRPPAVSVGSQVPDFHLVDVNPASARAGALVSPRDYAGTVTGWYFGHSS